jgi:hypothetical protein
MRMAHVVRFLYAFVSAERAAELLAECSEETFLVRLSPSSVEPTLVFTFLKAGALYGIGVKVTPHGFTHRCDNSTHTYDSLADAIVGIAPLRHLNGIVVCSVPPPPLLSVGWLGSVYSYVIVITFSMFVAVVYPSRPVKAFTSPLSRSLALTSESDLTISYIG